MGRRRLMSANSSFVMPPYRSADGRSARFMLWLTGHKWCGRCEQALPFAAFLVDRSKRDGLRSQCRECENASKRVENMSAEQIERQRARCRVENRSAAQREQHRKSSAAWALANPDKVLAKEQRRRAAKAGAPTDGHTAAELSAVLDERGLERCHYCGDVPEHIDHVKAIADGGAHAVANLVPACASCNSSKNAADVFDWLARRDPELLAAVDAAFGVGLGTPR